MRSAKRERIVLSTAVLMAAAIIIAGALIIYAGMINRHLIEEVNERGEQISERNEFLIEEEMKEQMNILMEISERITASGTLDMEREMSELKSINERHAFKRMVIALPDGTAYTTDDLEMDLSKREFFQRSMQGENFISGRLADYADGKDIIVFSVPIYLNDQVEGVVLASYSVQTMQKMLSVLTSEECDSYVVDDEGGIVVSSIINDTTDYDSQDIHAVLSRFGENSRDEKKMQKDIQQKKAGSIILEGKEETYVHYLSLGMNDWYIVNVISSEHLNSDRDYLMGTTYLLVAAVVFVFILFIAYIMGAEKKKRQKMEQLMNVDELTGGNTYLHFCDIAEEKLKHTDKKAALISMDIQNFKLINEMYGNQEGDRVLRYLYQFWENWVREDELFGRRIADRFFVLAFYDTPEEMLKRIEDFIEHVKNDNPQERKGHVFRPKLGVYLIPDNQEDFLHMQTNVIMAHAEAKKSSHAAYIIYNDQIKSINLRNKELEDEIEQAYEKREFIIYYQPKYDTKTKQIIGAEALIRWKKPDGTILTPYVFIPAAEQSGFIVKLDEYVFEMVCSQLREWSRKGKKLVPVSVNLSREHLREEDFIEKYAQIRSQKQIPEESIELEITESAIFQNPEKLLEIVNRLHNLGFRILMDDFGTGYSSLMMLGKVPVDVMKLDKSFIDGYEDDKGEKILVSTIRLAQSLDIGVTAEGVETEEQYKFLKELNCDVIQGYYFAKPMPAEEFEKMLEEN